MSGPTPDDPSPVDESTAGEATAAQPTLPRVDTSPQGEPRRPPTPEEPEEEEDPNAYKVKLDVFEGPLDLLLHLIRKHEVDILDIPISLITKEYLKYLKVMQDLQIDVASEYLVMAATLAHIKSKTLLPRPPEDQDDEAEADIDPRAELIRRLLEYQKYKRVAEDLGGRSIAGRDVFTRGTAAPQATGSASLAQVSVFKLIEALQKVNGYSGKLFLCNLSSTVLGVFQLANLDHIFQIKENREAALQG